MHNIFFEKKRFYINLHLSHSEDELHYRVESDIPFFGESVSALSYLAWEKKIEELHPFFASKHYILSLCISRFVGHVSE